MELGQNWQEVFSLIDDMFVDMFKIRLKLNRTELDCLQQLFAHLHAFSAKIHLSSFQVLLLEPTFFFYPQA